MINSGLNETTIQSFTFDSMLYVYRLQKLGNRPRLFVVKKDGQIGVPFCQNAYDVGANLSHVQMGMVRGGGGGGGGVLYIL